MNGDHHIQQSQLHDSGQGLGRRMCDASECRPGTKDGRENLLGSSLCLPAFDTLKCGGLLEGPAEQGTRVHDEKATRALLGDHL